MNEPFQPFVCDWDDENQGIRLFVEETIPHFLIAILIAIALKRWKWDPNQEHEKVTIPTALAPPTRRRRSWIES